MAEWVMICVGMCDERLLHSVVVSRNFQLEEA